MQKYFTILLLLVFNLCFSQTRIDSLISQLRVGDFRTVSSAQHLLVCSQKEAIPELIRLLKDTSFVKLRNTADLIYPGADKFYGHGPIIDYDIDWICVRAGWALEELTFQNFGYSDMTITEEKLMCIHQQNYPEYLKTGSLPVDFKSKTPAEQLKAYRLMLADSVSRWWEKNKDGWSRFSALKEALAGEDEQRQGLALQYMRYGETTCDGLTLDSYETEIKPLVEKIRDSGNGQSGHAKSLLGGYKEFWFNRKQNCH